MRRRKPSCSAMPRGACPTRDRWSASNIPIPVRLARRASDAFYGAQQQAPESVLFAYDKFNRQRARPRRQSRKAAVALHPGKILLGGDQCEVVALRLAEKRRSIRRAIAVVIGKAALDLRVYSRGGKRREELLRVADPRKGKCAAALER